jgi:hypothetical protein
MSLQLESILWDGTSLSAIIADGNRRITCMIPRDTVHALPFYNDAVGWEIDRYKQDIFERVKGVLENKLRETTSAPENIHFDLVPADLSQHNALKSKRGR